jgi:hypothetical protein
VTPFSSRFDRARAFWFAGLAVFLAGFVVFAMGEIGGWIACAVGTLIAWVADATQCPNCGKSLMRSYPLRRENAFRWLAFRNNMYPERTCSECGTQLDAAA